MAFDITAATPVLKQYYTPKKVETLVLQSPLLGIMPKDTNGAGVSYVGSIRSAITSAVSQTDTIAFTSAGASIYKQWVCPWRSGYARALVSGEVLDKTGNDRGAFVKAVISETEGAYDAIGQQIGAALWHNGGGSIGKLDGSTTVTGLLQTLSNISDAINFRVGQVLRSSATDGTTGAVRAGTGVTLTAVDLFTGVLTAAGNWDAGITGCVNTDYVFMDGDFGLAFQGIPAWIVPGSLRAATLGTSFNGVTRSADPVRLAGVPYRGLGGPKKESMIQLGMMLHRLKSKPSHFFLNDLDFADIAKDLTTNTRITTETAFKNPQIGFPAIEYAAPFGNIKIMTDPFLSQGTAYMLDMSTWLMPSMGQIPKVDFIDKMSWLRTAGADSYEFRTLYRCATYCSNPAKNGVVEF